MNPFEVGDLEPHEPRQKSTYTVQMLFSVLMVGVAGLILGLLVLFVFLALFVGWAMSPEIVP